MSYAGSVVPGLTNVAVWGGRLSWHVQGSKGHTAEVDDHVFAAQGSESFHQADFSQLDALSERFSTAFAEGTMFSGSDVDLATKESRERPATPAEGVAGLCAVMELGNAGLA